jgi:hypothetical protein
MKTRRKGEIFCRKSREAALLKGRFRIPAAFIRNFIGFLHGFNGQQLGDKIYWPRK